MEKLIGNVVDKYKEQSEFWIELLHKVMPKYFFKSFSEQQIETILPVLFNISMLSGIQKIVKDDKVILLYLKSEENNPVSAARVMTEYNVREAMIYETRQPLTIKGVARTLIIEHYTVAAGDSSSRKPLFESALLAESWSQKYSGKEPFPEEIYSRINWDTVGDLNAERLTEYLHMAARVQDKDYPLLETEKTPEYELKISYARTNSPAQGIYYRILSTLTRLGFGINRVYARQLTRQDDVSDFLHMPVTVTTVYLRGGNLSSGSKKVQNLLWQLHHLSWCDMSDLLHTELVETHKWSLPDANLMRAAATFIHSQLAYVDRNIYHHPDIWRLMALHQPLLRELLKLFYAGHQPGSTGDYNNPTIIKRLIRSINAINTGIKTKDLMVKTIFSCLLNFFCSILKTNFFVEDKNCLAFRLNPEFMKHYAEQYPDYCNAFAQGESPCGVFFFYRRNCIGFHVRFDDIARGGWRSVIPRQGHNQLEKEDSYEDTLDELFREVYVLAHTQHLKNKDIYEGGSKMITLLRQSSSEAQLPMLYQAQRTVSAAFLQLINSDASGRLQCPNVVDRLQRREIIEIGPDENMHDVMIDWLGRYAAAQHYILGSGLISGKADSGINHKEYGVTSYGVHQYLLKTLEHLGINPSTDAFSVKISGGPNGDVAGNELKLLLNKNADGSWEYPGLRINAITDSPAAIYDPDGIDREELTRLIHRHNLDEFAQDKLKGSGAYIIYSASQSHKGVEQHCLIRRQRDKSNKTFVGNDEYMNLFQSNLCWYADIFIPCGGRPATIDSSNWNNYVCNGRSGCRAVIEGANSFITSEARNHLQDAGIIVIKDASANKCGVITSSYEILCGLMLSEAEFKQHKPQLVSEIMEKLRLNAIREAEWLFSNWKPGSTCRLTELTDQLSRKLNALSVDVRKYLENHTSVDYVAAAQEYLPPLLRDKFADRLSAISPEYLRSIAATVLAGCIVYCKYDDMETLIHTALNSIKALPSRT